MDHAHQPERHQRAEHDAQHRRHVHGQHLPAQAEDALQVDGQREQHQRRRQEHVACDRVVEPGGLAVDQPEGVVDPGNEVAQQQRRHDAVELPEQPVAAGRCPENRAQRGGDQAEHDDVVADECAGCGCRHRLFPWLHERGNAPARSRKPAARPLRAGDRDCAGPITTATPSPPPRASTRRAPRHFTAGPAACPARASPRRGLPRAMAAHCRACPAAQPTGLGRIGPAPPAGAACRAYRQPAPHRRRPGNRGMRGGCLRLEGRACPAFLAARPGASACRRARLAAHGTKGRADGAPLPARGHCPMCCFNQALTVSCHCTLLCGLSTQWFSSGKYRNLDSMPLRCSAVNVARPCSTGMR